MEAEFFKDLGTLRANIMLLIALTASHTKVKTANIPRWCEDGCEEEGREEEGREEESSEEGREEVSDALASVFVRPRRENSRVAAASMHGLRY
jgi:hypothetical protein